MKKFFSLRGRTVGFLVIGVAAVTAVWMPLSAFAAPVSSGSVDLNAVMPLRSVVPAVQPMVLALEEQPIGDTSPFGAQPEASMAQTRLAGLTSLAALRERMGKSRDIAPVKVSALPIVLQVGSFANRDNAMRLESALASEFKSVYVTQSQLGDRQVFRVRVGAFATEAELESAEKSLRARGHKTWRLASSASDSSGKQLHSSR